MMAAATSGVSRLRSRRSSLGHHSDLTESGASKRHGVLSGPEEEVENVYNQGVIDTDVSPQASVQAMAFVPTETNGGARARETRMGKRQSRSFYQSDLVETGARATGLLPSTINRDVADGAKTRSSVGSNSDSHLGEQSVNLDVEESKSTEKKKELTRLAELVRAELKRAADAQIFEHLRRETRKAHEEMAVLRAKLGRAEAAVEFGKKERDADVAELERKLQHYQQELHRLGVEGEFHRFQQTKSTEEQTRLREELKRTQEALSFLSAWDEEKVELDAEVVGLKMKLAAATKDGEKRLEQAQQDFRIAEAIEGQKAQARLRRDIEKIKIELEKGLNDEFRSTRRENDVLRREKGRRDYETHRLMKSVARLEAQGCSTRAKLDDERRMHHTTIRRNKRAEAVIVELGAQLSNPLLASRPYSPSPGYSPRRIAAQSGVGQAKKPWNNARPAPRPFPPNGRAKLLLDGRQETCGVDQAGSVGSESGAEGDVRRGAGSGRRALSRRQGATTSGEVSDSDRAGGRGIGMVSTLLVPARSSDSQEDGTVAASATTCAAAPIHADGKAAPVVGGSTTARSFASSGGGRKRRRNGDNGVTGVDRRLDGDSDRGAGQGSRTRDNCNREEGEDEEEENSPELLPCDRASEMTSTDVWGMLDSYVRRRSEVTRANRHVKAIEAMRRHLAKNTERTGNAPGDISGNLEKHGTAQGPARAGRGDRSYNSEITADAGRERLLRRHRRACEVGKKSICSTGVLKLAAFVKDQRGPSGGGTKTRSAEIPTKPSKPNKGSRPHPLRRQQNASTGDWSASSLSQITAVRFWNEGGDDRHHLSKARNTIDDVPTTRTDDLQEQAGRGQEHWREGTTALTGAHRSQNSADADEHRRGTRGWRTSLSPPKNHSDARFFSRDNGACRGGDNDINADEGPTKSCEVRSPSSTSLAGTTITATATRVAKVVSLTNRLSREKVADGLFPETRRGGTEKSAKPPRGRAACKAHGRNRGVGLGGQRRTCRDLELVDWIQANTNLMNVSPW